MLSPWKWVRVSQINRGENETLEREHHDQTQQDIQEAWSKVAFPHWKH